MNKRLRSLAMGLAVALAVAPSPVSAGGAAKGTIVTAVVGSSDHHTLVTALKTAGLVDTLGGTGPFTVFAPTDAAFARLPAGTVDKLLQPANRDQLRSILTYHVVRGKVTSADLVKVIKKGGGKATNINEVTQTLSSNQWVETIFIVCATLVLMTWAQRLLEYCCFKAKI